jgi:hypothetical protein
MPFRKKEFDAKLLHQGSMLWSQFSAIFDHFWKNKLAFFSKTNVMIKILHYLALFRVKNANFFAKIFGENIYKIGPRSRCKPVSEFGLSRRQVSCWQMTSLFSESAFYASTTAHSAFCKYTGLPDFPWYSIPYRITTYQMAAKYTKRPKNRSNGHYLSIPTSSIIKHYQNDQKFTQFGIFLKIYHLATLFWNRSYDHCTDSYSATFVWSSLMWFDEVPIENNVWKIIHTVAIVLCWMCISFTMLTLQLKKDELAPILSFSKVFCNLLRQLNKYLSTK